MLIRNATLLNAAPVDIRIDGAMISEIASTLATRETERIIDAGGGVILPALHDHHIHLFALAASLNSFDCGQARTAAELAQGLQNAAAGKSFLRAVNYHDRIAGPIDRHWLDKILPNVAVRVQHRSGRLWILNSLALRTMPQGGASQVIERENGELTGRIYDGDSWLRGPFAGPAPDLAPVGRLLAGRGVTAVTDATPSNGMEFFDIVARAQESGELPQRVAVMGTASIAQAVATPALFPIAIKLHLHEGDYPSPEDFFALARTARSNGMALAIHCVTEADLVFTLSLLEECNSADIARIEHASLVPPHMLPRLAAAGVTVVTQPHFIVERGDSYELDIPLSQHDHLYRCATLKSAGVKLGCGTDAPFGNYDPWVSMQAATTRRTKSGMVLGRNEILSPEEALALYTTPLTDPGGAPRRVEVGQPADLCLLTQPWQIARNQLGNISVQATIRGGTLIHDSTERTRWGRKVA